MNDCTIESAEVGPSGRSFLFVPMPTTQVFTYCLIDFLLRMSIASFLPSFVFQVTLAS